MLYFVIEKKNAAGVYEWGKNRAGTFFTQQRNCKQVNITVDVQKRTHNIRKKMFKKEGVDYPDISVRCILSTQIELLIHEEKN